MARIRTVKPQFFRHRRLYLAERYSGLPLRVAFAGLWTCADREGRFRWEPDELKLDCLPYDEIDFSRVLDALLTHGFIVHYACSGREYGVIPGFKHHQVINNREADSELPPPPENFEQEADNKQQFVASNTREARVMDLHEGKGKEGKGKERNDDGDEPSALSSTKSTITKTAFDLTDEILVAMGRTTDDPLSIGGPYTVQAWLNGGISRDAIVLGVRTAMSRKQHDPPSTFKYFEKAVLRAFAELSRPLPKVEIRDAETITVTRHGKPKNAVIQASDDLNERLAYFDDRAGPDDICGSEGENAPRLLSHG